MHVPPRLPSIPCFPAFSIFVFHWLNVFPVPAIGSMFSCVTLLTCCTCYWLHAFPALSTGYMFPRLSPVPFFPRFPSMHATCQTNILKLLSCYESFSDVVFLPQGVLCKPLLLAARGGHKDIVEYLLQKGASPTEEDTVK